MKFFFWEWHKQWNMNATMYQMDDTYNAYNYDTSSVAILAQSTQARVMQGKCSNLDAA